MVKNRSARFRIWRYGERSVPSMRTASFLGFFTSHRRRSLLSTEISREFLIIYKIALITFSTSLGQVKMASRIYWKCYELRCHGVNRPFRKPKHTNEHIKKDSIRYFVEKFWKLWTWAKIKAVIFSVLRILDRYNKHAENPQILIWTKRSWNYSLTSLVTIWLYTLICKESILRFCQDSYLFSLFSIFDNFLTDSVVIHSSWWFT